MKQFFWLIVGILAGFVVAHKVNQTEQGKAFFANIDAKTRDFTEALIDGYKEREAELRAARNNS
ncbi:hypothetical protein M2119_001240 [Aurantimicrobium minutum]|uniref:hypothetical protein n=1 Tax=Aurantimicrobium minutum TaxID=708131 RepID=UPI0024764A6F|nr:hypothetical protein [Aurantimicrobium minutum]MDH6533003.1 hypothetical protein [Aurantimicrobium minutum]